jgi:hypothetical protein
MPRSSLVGVILAAAIIVACYFLMPGQILEIYESTYRTIPLGNLLATIHAIFLNGSSNVPLFTWLIAGFIAGLTMRSGSKGFTAPFYASLYMLIVFYPASVAFEIVPLPHTLQGEFILIRDFIYPFVANWIIGGIGGLIGGRASRLLPKKAPSEVEEKSIVEKLPITCPNCGISIYSNSAWCANCGKKLE